MNIRAIALDIETTGLDQMRDKIISYAVCDQNLKTRFWYDSPEARREISEICSDRNLHLVFHNAPFDLTFLHRIGIKPRAIIEDTMVMSHILDPTFLHGRHGLKELSVSKLSADIEDFNRIENWVRDNKKEFLAKHGRKPARGDAPKELVEPYNREDTVRTMKLFYLFRRPVMREYRDVYEVEQRLIPSTVAMQLRGIRIDLDYCKRRIGELKRENAKIVHQWRGVSLGSPKQIAEKIFPDLGIIPQYYTETGRPATDKKTLEFYAQEFPKLRQILVYRFNQKKISTYFGNLIGLSYHSDIHCRFIQNGARTGRYSSQAPNLQNIPRAGKGVRRAFIPRPGHVFVFFDFDQIELRILSYYTKDPQLVDDFKKGRDVHETTARRFLKVDRPIEYLERRTFKIINYCMMYGMGPWGISMDLGIPIERALAFYQEYFRLYPSLRRAFKELGEKVLAEGLIKDIFGRQYKIMSSEESYKAVNYLIQGCAGGVLKRAQIKVHNYLKGKPARLLMTIHDELMVEAPLNRSFLNTMVPQIRKMMTVPSSMFDVPIPVGVKWTKTNWEDTHEWEEFGRLN